MENRNDDLKHTILPVEGMSFISVNAGNSQIKWSFHKPSDWLPYLFWETCHIQHHARKDQAAEASENNVEPISGNLVEYLPPIVCNYIFGKDQSFTYESARRNLLSEAAKVTSSFSTTSHTELLRVYIVSSSLEQTKLLQDLWPRTCPCIVYVLQNSFFGRLPQQQTLPYYEGMGTDRTAAATSARLIYGLPTLVFDAGTALTYTALDVEGNIIGGGIVPGIQLALTTLHQATSGRLPRISIVEEQQQQQQQQHELRCNLFETNTKDAILSATLEQTLSYIRRIIAGWLHLVGEPPKNTTQTVAEYVSSIISGDRSTSKLNDSRCVVFTGGDGMLLHTLLTRDNTSTTSMTNMGLTAGHDNRESKVANSVYLDLLKLNNDLSNRCSMSYNGHLIHVGIAHTLLLHSTNTHRKLVIIMPPREELSKTIVKARVAKKIHDPNHNTTYSFGKVIELHEKIKEMETPESTTEFVVEYADGSREMVNLKQLSGKVYRKIY
jgi:pantothenate kinase type III